ncbi:MAG TPA: SRPBCC domain-containing protein [Rhizomicrobium sp.]|nr:SRPBCC domain-containing protein [Rhizomicrobium sp.]
MDAQLHSRELTITRVFDAPRDLVFKAWTDGRMLAQWFGPQGFTNPICECDARVGGKIRIVMRGEFTELDPPRRLAFINNAVDQDDNVVLNGLTTVSFEEQGRKTKMTFHTRASGTLPQVVFMLQGMEAGWTQSFDKMDAMFAGKPA